ncbi:orotidine-5'-phosphate decarboxylase [Helicobacter trogontum]|uniref:Orotidine 5'-phosphate decarboxylase n=1 Tax=Helicobacter trogontum TaxID=50960 RepID=A0A4U8S8T7_9HELI|nr:orotidine-5'-phosphate decarboxylase [Helicobacter trogontum]TLD82345.1 orotidine-5'-phosphate decarboxylase [Helicobacter trogontum]
MKLCIALDMPSMQENLKLAKEVQEHFSNEEIWLKVGLRSFVRDGRDFVCILQDLGFRIFLDLKIYDIPNTMLDCVYECHKLGVDMMTIHASCGKEAMRSIAKLLRKESSDMRVVAVSALTSFDEDGFREIYNTSIQHGVNSLANIVYESGIDGLVCSIDEVSLIKSISNTLFTVTPGIRLESSSDDQKRTANVKVAKKIGSDFIVVGRPIYNAIDKVGVIKQILNDMKL